MKTQKGSTYLVSDRYPLLPVLILNESILDDFLNILIVCEKYFSIF